MTKKTETKKVQTEQTKELNFQTKQENLEFHDFEKNPTFIGTYETTITIGEGENSLEVNIMRDYNTGERMFVKNSHAINKTIAGEKAEHDDLSNVVFEFTFEGKTVNKKGKPVNKFKTRVAYL